MTDALARILEGEVAYETREVNVEELRIGMILAQDVFNTRGMLLVRKGQKTSALLLLALRNCSRAWGVQEPIRVNVLRPGRAGGGHQTAFQREEQVGRFISLAPIAFHTRRSHAQHLVDFLA